MYMYIHTYAHIYSVIVYTVSECHTRILRIKKVKKIKQLLGNMKIINSVRLR